MCHTKRERSLTCAGPSCKQERTACKAALPNEIKDEARGLARSTLADKAACRGQCLTTLIESETLNVRVGRDTRVARAGWGARGCRVGHGGDSAG